MRRKTTLTAIALFTTVIIANAGILYLELPEEITIEMAQNPTEVQKGIIDNFILFALNEIDSDGADRVIMLTKDGEVIPDNHQIEGLTVSGSGEEYFQLGDLRLVRGNDWENDEWESIQEHITASYHISKNVFGAPVVAYYHEDDTRKIAVTRVRDYENEWGAYVIKPDGSDAIWLKTWPMEGAPVDIDTARAHLTRNMLHAFRWKAAATWDQFGAGMVHAAWLDIQKRIAEEYGLETQFNDANHDSLLPDDPNYRRPYYASVEMYNANELSTNRPLFFPERSKDVNHKIKKARYGACGYVWWKVYEKAPNFIWHFNDELTKTWNGAVDYIGGQWYFPDDKRPKYGDMRKCALESWWQTGQPAMEGFPFDRWLERQPIVDNEPTLGYQVLLTTDRNVAQVFCYKRDANFEIADDYEVNIKKKNCWAQYIYQEFDITLDDGFGEVQFNLLGSDESFVFDIESNVGTEVYNNRSFAYGGLTNNRKNFYGVLPFQSPGGGRPGAASEGELTVTDDFGHSHTLVGPYYGNNELKFFGFNSDLWPGFDPIESDTLYCHFEPNNPQTFESYNIPLEKDYTLVRDSGSYGLYRAFIPDEDTNPIDLDDNLIPDLWENELAEKFCPNVYMHNDNRMKPHSVDITMEPGALTETIYVPGDPEDPDDEGHYEYVWYRPEIGESMYDIFLEKENEWDNHWFVAFGSQDGSHSGDNYWHNEYEEWGQRFPAPTIYYNMFIDDNDGLPVIQYWFFYPYNDWVNEHEGDWEGVCVKLTGVEPNYAQLHQVAFYLHSQYYIADPHSLSYEDGHVVVFVGGFGGSIVGSGHESGASYWRHGRFENVSGDIDEIVLITPNSTKIRYDDPDLDLRCIRKYPRELYSQYPFGGEENQELNEKLKDTVWLRFPGTWGRPNSMVGGGKNINYKSKEVINENEIIYNMNEGINGKGAQVNPPPPGPWFHSRWNSFRWEGHTMYEGDLFKGNEEGNSSGSSNSSPAFPFALHQTYPNPAKAGSVNFAFSVPDNCRATLSVFDITGRKVAVPFDEKIIPGEYVAEMNAASLPAGVYLYRLEAGSDVAVKKMVITK